MINLNTNFALNEWEKNLDREKFQKLVGDLKNSQDRSAKPCLIN